MTQVTVDVDGTPLKVGDYVEVVRSARLGEGFVYRIAYVCSFRTLNGINAIRLLDEDAYVSINGGRVRKVVV